MADKNEVTATCPFCRRPQAIPPAAGRVVCRHCQNAFAWDNKTASGIILPPPSITGDKRPVSERHPTPAPKPTPKAFSSKVLVLILALLLLLAGGGAAAYFFLQAPEKPYFPDNLDPASVLEEVGKQLKAITE